MAYGVQLYNSWLILGKPPLDSLVRLTPDQVYALVFKGQSPHKKLSDRDLDRAASGEFVLF